MGFFSAKQLQSSSQTRTGKTASCAGCGFYKGLKHSKMEPWGKGKKKILLVGKCPSTIDAKQGTSWAGAEGRWLEHELKKIGIDRYEDCWTTFSMRCHAEQINAPDVEMCRPKLLRFIKQVKPKIIITFGQDALCAVVGHSWKKGLGSINRWRGYRIPDRVLNAWVCPITDPYHIMFPGKRTDPLELVQTLFRNDLEEALNCPEFPTSVNDEKFIHIIDTPGKFRKSIAEIKKASLISFDYETTGVKPHRAEQEILCTACAVSPEKVFVWMNNERRNRQWAKILKSDIPKTAHNFTFEDAWSRQKIGPVNNWKWCSMNTAHIIDNRQGIIGLKFQVYVTLGVGDYDSEVAGHLQTTGEEKEKYGSNGMNRLKEFMQSRDNRKKVLTYCGLDALYGYQLTLNQMGAVKDA